MKGLIPQGWVVVTVRPADEEVVVFSRQFPNPLDYTAAFEEIERRLERAATRMAALEQMVRMLDGQE